MKKILITGGHLTPALAMIDYMSEHKKPVKLVFVGRKFAQKSTGQLAVEEAEITQRQLQFIFFDAPKLESETILSKVVLFFQLLTAIARAMGLLTQIRPDLILSFGSYLSVPVGIAAWILGIPILTHDQTLAPGLSTRLLARIATKVALSFPQATIPNCQPTKIVISGNPLNLKFFAPAARPAWLPRAELPLLLVLGGSQGSDFINQLISQILPKLEKNWLVIHQIGPEKPELNQTTNLNNAMSLSPHYFPKPRLQFLELAWSYQNATAVLSRAGANTIQEIVAFQIPAILIPLPQTHFDEQTQNAHWAEKVAPVQLLPQSQATPATVLDTLTKIKTSRKKFEPATLVRDQPHQRLWHEIAQIFKLT